MSLPAGSSFFSRPVRSSALGLFTTALLLSTAVVTVLPGHAEARRGGYTRVIREPAPDTPLTIVISLERQQLQVFDRKGLVAQSPISSGRPGYDTPTGIFSILQKNREHYSNLYDDAPMPNMQRLTWSGVALHAGQLPGYPASHGCIRLPYGFSRQLFSMTDIGTRVIVADDMVEPEQIRHPRLFAALPPGRTNIPMPQRRPDADVPAAQTRSVGTVSAMLGVTPAAAAEAAIKLAASHAQSDDEKPAASTQRTRAMALAERQAEIDQRAAELEKRKDAHADAAAVARGVNEQLAEARLDLKKSRLAIRDLDRDVRDGNNDVRKAEQRMRDFVRDQSREQARAVEREEERRRQHAEDGASTLEADELLKRVEARNAEAKRDEDARTAAAARETQLETELLQAMHDLEAAELIRRSQDSIISAREAAIETIETQLVDARKAYATAKNALDEAEATHRRAVAALNQFTKPATVFISRRTGTLHIRQGFSEVYQAPVTFNFPDARVGTHVFTATSYSDETETALDWQAMTLTDVTPELPHRIRRRGRQVEIIELTTPPPPAPTAANALERFDIPEDARQRIAELIKPGSTLIISDVDVSPETGKGTDIIVQPRSSR